jgi:cell division protein FtsI/penicillin-binding protein 2
MGLSVIDAAFFSVSTITTVGYGEAQDELTDSDKLFIIFFTLFGVNICWIIVGNLILYVVNVFTSNMKYTRKKFAERVDILAERKLSLDRENSAYASNKHSTNLETKPSLLQRMLTGVSVDFNQEEEISMEEYIELSRFQNKRTQNKLFRGFLRNIFIIFVLLFFGTVIYACIESESIVNSLFWAIDTLCSVNVVI